MSGFIIRTKQGDIGAGSVAEVRDLWLQGRFGAGSFIYSEADSAWSAICDHAALQEFFGQKPASTLEKSLIYIIFPGISQSQQGPFTLSRVKQMIQNFEISPAHWVFVEGDKEWRQVKTVKALKDLLPPVPTQAPAPVAASAAAPPLPPKSKADVPTATDAGVMLGSAMDFAGGATTSSTGAPPVSFVPTVNTDADAPALSMSADSDGVVHADESTKAVSVLGLNLDTPSEDSAPALELSTGSTNPSIGAPPTPPPPGASSPPRPPLPAAAAGATGAGPDQSSFNGITAEISTDPVWLIKQNNSDGVSGPFKFLDVVKLLEQGKISKNDKISRVGTNRFNKISQQYEFNVTFEVTKKIENGAEIQKILIRRRHPRVDYFASIYLTRSNGATAQAACVNISAGGVLLEASKLDLTIGENIDIKILPGLIDRQIQAKALVTSKVPKIPPGFSVEFSDLKPEDKEAIERYVQDALKKEQLKG